MSNRPTHTSAWSTSTVVATIDDVFQALLAHTVRARKYERVGVELQADGTR